MTISEQTETSPPPPPPAPERPPASVHTSYARVLRAVLLRELRQNWIVVALVFLAEFLFLALGEASGSGGFMAYRYDPLNILLYGSLRFCVPASCIVGGLVIGLFQPLPDRNFDRWAFGIHRPVPRWLLFLGRVAAGVLLYALSVGVPLCLLLLYSTTSSGGHFFLWQYTLPYIADFFTGLVFYGTGLLVVDRRALICGSKVAPLVLAAAACALSLLLPSFIAALFSSLVFIVLFAFAALGSFVSHGYTLPRRPLTRFANTVVLLLSFSILLGLASTAVDSWINGKRNEAMNVLPLESFPKRPPVTEKSHAVLADGSLASVVSADSNDGSARKNTYFDSSGNPIENLKLSIGQVLHRLNYRESDHHGYRDLEFLAQDEISFPSHRPGTPEIRNHWIFDHTRNIFFIYTQPPVPYRFLGTFGSTGFKTGSINATPFAPLFQNPNSLLLTTEKAIFLIDKLAFSASTLFVAPDGEAIQSYQTWRTNDETDLTTCIVTDQGIYLRNEKGLQLRFPLNRRALNTDILRLYRIPSKRWWIVEYAAFNYPAAQQSQRFEFYDDQAALLSVQEFPEIREGFSAPVYSPAAQAIEERYAARIAIADMLLREPMPIRPWSGWMEALAARSPYAARFFQSAYYFSPSGSVNFKILQWIALAGWALGAWFLAKFYRASWPLLWGAMGLLIGPALLLAFISTHKFPTRLKCPNCHARRPIADSVCPNCKAPWPTPVKTGTEIFT